MSGTKIKADAGRPVLISNTAATMLSTLFPQSPAKMRAAIAQIQSDIQDPAKVRKIVGRDDVFVARGHGMRIVFKRGDTSSVITSVAAEG